MANWFRPRRYKHFDRPVNEAFAKRVMKAAFIERHAFSLLMGTKKITKRYRPEKNKTVTKARPIMYASHKDACILSYYAYQMVGRLNEFYEKNCLVENVIAYRALGLSNYDFSHEAVCFAVENAPCKILAFDVSGFFDNLDHHLLKKRLKTLLNVSELSDDWYRVFRFVTKYHYVDIAELKTHKEFRERLRQPGSNPVATVAELKRAGVRFHANSKGRGIPQGTPISAVMSNLYMMDFDIEAKAYCEKKGAFYRRYSDDILVICSPEKAPEVEERIRGLVAAEKLDLSLEKTERTDFDPASKLGMRGRSAQYLGFAYYPGGVGIRPSSLSRQWRKMRRSIRRAKMLALENAENGKAPKVYTKKLRRRFSPMQFRNFSSYARRSAAVFGGGEKIGRQVRRLELAFDRAVRDLQKKFPK